MCSKFHLTEPMPCIYHVLNLCTGTLYLPAMTSPNYSTSFVSSDANCLAQEWMHICDTKHKACAKSITISDFILPRRLLDIGTSDSKGISLVETANIQDKGCRYATLSHRWGDPDQLLQTTISNIHEHYKLIAWDALPKTFKDAVTVTRCLGLRYLWIDSLCIIQKNRTDFETECSSMHLIYLNCYCMIAASDSADASEGFLQFWTRSSAPAFNTSIDASQVSENSRGFGPRSTRFRHNQYIKWTEWMKVLDGQLHKRGWTFQEWQLAPRILHFTKHGLMWECRMYIGADDSDSLQLRRSAWGLELGSNLGSAGKSFLPQSKFFRVLDRDVSHLSLDDLMSKWLELVEEYSERQLSHLADKLPALSGLAAAISVLIEKSSSPRTPLYLAGMWLSHMHRQLFWCPLTPARYDVENSKSSRGKYVSLPSWSWSSSMIPITFDYALARLGERSDPVSPQRFYTDIRRLRPQRGVEYVSTDIGVEGSNPFGRIKGSILQIQGYFLDQDFSHANMTWEECQQYKVFCGKNKQHPITVAFDYEPFSLQRLRLRLLFLLDEPHTSFHTVYWHCGIVLEAAEAGHHRRIGIFCVFLQGAITDLDWDLMFGEMNLV